MMVTTEADWPDRLRERNADGWFNAPPPMPSVAKLVRTDGLLMRYAVSPNLLEGSEEVAYRQMTAWWTPANRRPLIAHGSVALLSAGPCASNDALIAAADGHSQTAYDLVELLCRCYQKQLRTLLAPRQTIAHFELLEVHVSQRGRGLGAQLGAQLLALLRARFRAAAILLKPFPLQYPIRLHAASKLMPAFQRDRAKLAGYYTRHWNAFELPGDAAYQLAPGIVIRSPTDIRVRNRRGRLNART